VRFCAQKDRGKKAIPIPRKQKIIGFITI